MKNLNEVLSRLEKRGFRLKQEKCTFLAHSVEYLGHRIDKEGISALPRKVEAIANASHPTDVQELRSVLDLINYYGKFIQDLATLLHPLNHSYRLTLTTAVWLLLPVMVVTNVEGGGKLLCQ